MLKKFKTALKQRLLPTSLAVMTFMSSMTTPAFAETGLLSMPKTDPVVVDFTDEDRPGYLAEMQDDYIILKKGETLNEIFREMAEDEDENKEEGEEKLPNTTIESILVVDKPVEGYQAWHIAEDTEDEAYAYYVDSEDVEDILKAMEEPEQEEAEPTEEEHVTEEAGEESANTETEEKEEQQTEQGTEEQVEDSKPEETPVEEVPAEEQPVDTEAEAEAETETETEAEPAEEPEDESFTPQWNEEADSEENEKKGCIMIYTEGPIAFNKDSAHMFKDMEALKDISGLSEISFAKVEDATGMFEGCKKLRDLTPIALWKTDNLKNVTEMFAGCEKLEDISLLNEKDVMARQKKDDDTFEDVKAYTAWDVSDEVEGKDTFKDTAVDEEDKENVPEWYEALKERNAAQEKKEEEESKEAETEEKSADSTEKETEEKSLTKKIVKKASSIKLAANKPVTAKNVDIRVVTVWGTQRYDWLQNGHKSRAGVFYDNKSKLAVYCINKGKAYSTDYDNVQNLTTAAAASKISGLEWLKDDDKELRLGIILKYGYQATQAQMEESWDHGDEFLWKYGVTQILIWANAAGYWTNSTKMNKIRNTSLQYLPEDTSVSTVKAYWDEIISKVNKEFKTVQADLSALHGTASIYVGIKKQQEHAAFAGNGPSPYGEARIKKVWTDPDADSNPLYVKKGIQIGIYTSKSVAQNDTAKGSKAKYKLTVKANGYTDWSPALAPGTYYVRELTEKSWYKPKNKVIEVAIKDGDKKTVEFPNVIQPPSAKLKLHKVAMDPAYAAAHPDKLPLAGAQFTVYGTYSRGKLGSQIGVLTTDESGYTGTITLSAGVSSNGTTYYMKETALPTGADTDWQMNTTIYRIVVKQTKLGVASIEIYDAATGGKLVAKGTSAAELTYDFTNPHDVQQLALYVKKVPANPTYTNSMSASFPLAGAEYTIYSTYNSSNGSLSNAEQTLTTNAEGLTGAAEFSPASYPATYYFKETKVPTGSKYWILNPTIYRIELTQVSGGDVQMTVYDAPVGGNVVGSPVVNQPMTVTSEEGNREVPTNVALSLTKIPDDEDYVAMNSDAYSLAGAEYTVYSQYSGGDVSNPTGDVFVTDADGATNEIEFEVGTYYFKETKVPNTKYWKLDQTIYRVVVAMDGQNPRLTVYDAATGGEVVVTGLRGDTINAEVMEPTTKKYPSRIQIKKMAETLAGESIEPSGVYAPTGIQFELYDDASCTEEHLAATFEIKDDGTSDISIPLWEGQYWLKETYIPEELQEYYELSNTVVGPISLTDSTEGEYVWTNDSHYLYASGEEESEEGGIEILDGGIPELAYSNQIQEFGSMRIYKYSSDETYVPYDDYYQLQGATFRVTGPIAVEGLATVPNDWKIDETLVVDEEGFSPILEHIHAGTYRVEEVTAPQGFKKTTGYVDVEVGIEGIVECAWDEEPYPWGHMRIRKYSEADGTGLSGAKFKIYAYNTNTNTYDRPIETTDWYEREYKKAHDGATPAAANAGFMEPESDPTYYYTGVLRGDALNPNGLFKIVETVAPAGHVADWTYELDVRELQRDPIPFQNVSNSREPKTLYLYKIDAETQQRLTDSAFVFRVYERTSTGAWSTTYKTMTRNAAQQRWETTLNVTAENGGVFRVVEYAAPGNYGPVGQAREVRITNDTPATIEITMTNNKGKNSGKVYVKKQASDNNAVLSGTIFGLYEHRRENSTWVWVRKETLVYNPTTKLFESSVFLRNDNSASADYNNGQFKVVEEQAEDGYINAKWESGTFTVVDKYAQTGDATWLTTPQEFHFDGTNGSSAVINNPNEFTLYKTTYADKDKTYTQMAKLAGAVFKFTNLTTQQEFTVTTSNGSNVRPFNATTRQPIADMAYAAAGTIHVYKFPANTSWQVEEISAPAGYERSTEKLTFSVDADGKINGQTQMTSVFTNTPGTTLTVTKTDSVANSASVPGSNFPEGTEFSVYEYDTALSGYKTTPMGTLVWQSAANRFVDSATNDLMNLKWTATNLGRYKIVETAWSDGYVHTAAMTTPAVGGTTVIGTDRTGYIKNVSNNAEIKIPNDGSVSNIALSFRNTPNKYTIQKQNENGQAMNSGVAFKVWKGNNVAAATEYTVNSTGKIEIYRLSPGVWHYQESMTRPGYRVDETIYTFEVGENGNITGTATATVKNYPTDEVVIDKTETHYGAHKDSTTGFPVGTEFYIYEWSDELGDYKAEPISHVIYDASQNFTPQGEKSGAEEDEDPYDAGDYEGDIDVVLIDTGASLNENVVKRASVVGDDMSDAVGHGNAMAECITSEYADAKIYSIKAFDEEASADVDNIIEAMEMAMEIHPKVINMSFVAKKTAKNERLNKYIDKAVEQGIVVVVAAGNQGGDTKDYVPANNPNALVVAAMHEDNSVDGRSNYGDTTDAGFVAESTSSAAAKMTGYILAQTKGSRFALQRLNEIVQKLVATKHKVFIYGDNDTEKDALLDGRFHVQATNWSIAIGNDTNGHVHYTVYKADGSVRRSGYTKDGTSADDTTVTVVNADAKDDYIKLRAYVTKHDGETGVTNHSASYFTGWNVAPSTQSRVAVSITLRKEDSNGRRIWPNWAGVANHVAYGGIVYDANIPSGATWRQGKDFGYTDSEQRIYGVTEPSNGYGTSLRMLARKNYHASVQGTDAADLELLKYSPVYTNCNATATNYSPSNPDGRYLQVNGYHLDDTDCYYLLNGSTKTYTNITTKKLVRGSTTLDMSLKNYVEQSGQTYTTPLTAGNNNTHGYNVVAHANWKLNTYKVHYDANGGTGAPADQSFTFKNSINLNDGSTLTRTGYTFYGWYDNPEGTGTRYPVGWTYDGNDNNGTPEYKANNAVVRTLYAKWLPNAYTVRFDPGDGGHFLPSGLSSLQNKHWDDGEPLQPANEMVEWFMNEFESYSFDGWNTKEDGSGTSYPDQYTGNIAGGEADGAQVVLYAQWKENPKVTLTYNANGGATNSTPPKTVIEREVYKDFPNTQVLDADTFSRRGYTFEEWNTSANGDGTSYAAGSYASFAAATTLYAKWSENQYNIQYNANADTTGNATKWSDSNVAYTATVTMPGVGTLARQGYHFGGWNTSADGNGTNYNGGQSVSNFFVNWLTNINPNLADGATVQMYAKWIPNNFTVHYDANGGNGAPANQSGTVGTTMTLSSTKPTKTGYKFSGWKNGSSTYTAGQANVDFGLQENGAVINLQAQWTPIKYTVAYNKNGATAGAVPSSHTNVAYDQNITIKAPTTALTKTGYHQNGWYSNTTGTGGTAYVIGNSYRNLTATDGATVTLYVKWEPNTYTIHYDGNGKTGGTVPSDQTNIAYNANVTLATNNLTRTGYQRNGWNTKADGTGTHYASAAANQKNLAGTTQTDNSITLYAEWTPNSYTVKFNANGGTGTMANQSRKYDDGKALTANAFTREGWSFGGWNTKADGTGTSFSNLDTRNLTSANGTTVNLYAVWSQDMKDVYVRTMSGSNAVPNTKFKLYAVPNASTAPTSGTLLGTFDSGSGGTVHIGNQPVGQILAYVEEQANPAYNAKGSTPIYLTVSAAGGVQQYLDVQYTKDNEQTAFVDDVTNTFPAISKTADNPTGKFKLVEIATTPGYVMPKTKAEKEVEFTMGPTQTDSRVTYDATNHKVNIALDNEPNHFQFIKTTEDGTTPLPGAVITVWYENQTSQGKDYTVPESGIVDLWALKPGTWHYKEKTAPSGYALNNATYDIFVDADGYIYGTEKEVLVTTSGGKKTPRIENSTTASGSAVIRKVDETGAPIAGVQFDVRNPSNQTTRYTTDASGTIVISNITATGTWYYTEVASTTITNQGLIQDTAQKRFTVTKSGTTYTTTYNNDGGVVTNRHNEFIIRKVDAANNAVRLAGVTFKITAPDNSVQTLTTDANGEIRLTGMRPGTWKYQETATLPGYVLNSTQRTFTVATNGTVTGTGVVSGNPSYVQVTNSQVEIRLKKVDAESTTTGLQDAVIEIWSADGTFETTETTNASGEIVLKGIKDGTYYYREVTQPSGYIKDSTRYTFTVTNGVANRTNLQIANHKNRVIIQKVNYNNQAMNGVMFTLYKKSGSSLTSFRTATTSSGSATFSQIPQGEYVIKEALTNTNYLRSDGEVSFRVGADGRIANMTSDTADITTTPSTYGFTYKWVNHLKSQATLKVLKVDENGNNVKQPAVFQLYYENPAYNPANPSAASEFILYGIFTPTMSGSTYTGEYTVGPIIPLNYNTTGRWKIVEATSPNGYTKAADKIVVLDNLTDTATATTYTYSFVNTQKDLLIRKVDEDGQVVPGVTFEIKIPGQGTIERTTNASGEIEIKGVPYTNGTPIEVKEKSAPAHLQISADVYKFNITADGSAQVVATTLEDGTISVEGKTVVIRQTDKEVPPPKDITVRIEKKNASGTRLSGAEFVVYQWDNTITRTDKYDYDNPIGLMEEPGNTGFYSTINPLVWTEKNEGKFKFEETKAPAGYVKPAAGTYASTFTIDPNGAQHQSKTFTGSSAIINTPNSLTLYKTDASVGGAKLTDSNGTIVFKIRKAGAPDDPLHLNDGYRQVVINNDGESELLTAFAPGRYEITEVSTKPGYVLDTTVRTFTVDATTGVLLFEGESSTAIPAHREMSIENTPNLVRMKKVGENNQTLAGATFTIYDVTGWSDFTGTVTTAANGRGTIEGVVPGSKLVVYGVSGEAPRMVTAPASSQATVNVTVNAAANKTYKYMTLNPDAPAGLQGTDLPASGSDGIISMPKVPDGEFVLLEKAAPTDYVIDGAERRFVVKNGLISEDGENGVAVYELPEFPNTKKQIVGAIRIEKRATGTNTLLEGAEFVAYPFDATAGDFDMNSPIEMRYNSSLKMYEAQNLELNNANEWKFRIVEAQAPSGYIGDFSVEVDLHDGTGTDTKTLTLNGANAAHNTPNKLIVRKEDEESGEPLEGAIFELAHDSDTGYFDVTVPASGEKYLPIQAGSNYYWTRGTNNGLVLNAQIATTDGYKFQGAQGSYRFQRLNDEYETVQPNASGVVGVTFGSRNRVYVLTSEDGTLVDARISDASGIVSFAGLNPELEYRLYTAVATDKVVEYLTTNAAGVAEITALESDTTYELREIVAPESYELNEEVFEIRVDEDGRIEGEEEYTVTVTDKKIENREITISKGIRARDINFENGTPTFIFRIYGEDKDGNTIEKYHTITFTEAYVKGAPIDNDGYVYVSDTLKDIPLGEYDISEMSVMRYDLQDIIIDSGATMNADGRTVHTNLIANESANVLFRNEIKNFDGDTDTESVVNVVVPAPEDESGN